MKFNETKNILNIEDRQNYYVNFLQKSSGQIYS